MGGIPRRLRCLGMTERALSHVASRRAASSGYSKSENLYLSELCDLCGKIKPISAKVMRLGKRRSPMATKWERWQMQRTKEKVWPSQLASALPLASEWVAEE